jgi:hypothetical protein
MEETGTRSCSFTPSAPLPARSPPATSQRLSVHPSIRPSIHLSRRPCPPRLPPTLGGEKVRVDALDSCHLPHGRDTAQPVIHAPWGAAEPVGGLGSSDLLSGPLIQPLDPSAPPPPPRSRSSSLFATLRRSSPLGRESHTYGDIAPPRDLIGPCILSAKKE